MRAAVGLVPVAHHETLAHELVVTAQPVTVEAADRLIEGIDQADLDTFVAVLAKLKENADNYSNNG